MSQFNNILCFGYHDYSKQNRIDIGEFDNSFVTHEIDFITEKYSYLKCNKYTNYIEMFEKEKLDGVIIVTVAKTHLKIILGTY